MISSSLNNSTYYINRLNPTSYSSNKYVYLSGFEGNINIVDEQWIFNFKLYLNGDFNVPTNTLFVDLITPFAEKKDSTIVQQSITGPLPDYVDKSTKANLYVFNAIIPTDESKYFDSKFINQRINVDLGFHVNPENLNKTDIDETSRSEFIKEFDGIRTSTNILYTNYQEGYNQGSGSIIEEYYVVNDNHKVVNPKYFGWTMNKNCLDLTAPLTSLVDIELKGNFIVRGYKVEFFYSIEDSEIKTLSEENNNPKFCTDRFHLDCPMATKYDEIKREVVKIEGSCNGFFIPKNAYGYYTITILLSTANNWIGLKLNKSFNFIADSSYETNIDVEQFWIDDLNKFKRMVI